MARTSAFLTAFAVAVTLAASAGCTAKEDEQMSDQIPREAPPGAELVCGMAQASLELATASLVGEADRTLPGDGVVCAVQPAEPATFNGPLAWVTVLPVDSAAGVEEVARINAEGFREPDFDYPDLVGAAWGDLHPDDARMGLTAVCSIVVGDQVVQVGIDRSAVGRTPQVDLLALARQVAGSLGLVEG